MLFERKVDELVCLALRKHESLVGVAKLQFSVDLGQTLAEHLLLLVAQEERVFCFYHFVNC